MTDDTSAYRYQHLGGEADRLLNRVKAYLGRRRAADWGFFLVGVVLGGWLF